MMLLPAASTFAIVIVTLAIVVLYRQLTAPSRTLPLTTDWLAEISPDRYRPMLRVLDDQDVQFLRTQPGFTVDMERNLRAQRSQIFNGYLKSLESDFQRICTALKLVMVQSRTDRPELSSALLKAQFSFGFGVMMVRCHLALYRWNMAHVDVSPVVQLFEGMRVELRSFVPAGMPGMA
jgi:hypothetical protein